MVSNDLEKDRESESCSKGNTGNSSNKEYKRCYFGTLHLDMGTVSLSGIFVKFY